MNRNRTEYRVGYNWVLNVPSVYETGIIGYEATTDFVCLSFNGNLFLSEEYAIDGISGVTGYPWEKLIARPWLKNNCWPHDGLYQLMRLNLIPRGLKDEVDKSFGRGCLRDGAYRWQANLAYNVVSKYGSVMQNEIDVHPIFLVP